MAQAGDGTEMQMLADTDNGDAPMATYTIRVERVGEGDTRQLVNLPDCTPADAMLICLEMSRYFERRIPPEQADALDLAPPRQRRRRGRPPKEETALREARAAQAAREGQETPSGSQ